MLSWVICCSWLYSAQAQDIQYTDNIVTPTTQATGSTWSNAVYQDSLTCWTWGNPGYCGPNAIVRPGDNINFSFGSTYVFQQPWASAVLPDSGTGLVVRGYTFSFTAKNGNGWDDGRTDQLTALVRFWDTTGGRGSSNVLASAQYNLSYQFNWTDFNFTETWATPLQATQVGQIQYGFLGRDNNGWAGPYGPEITNVSFRVQYSIDPCAQDPLSSPTCQGYAQALLASLAPQTTAAIEPALTPEPVGETPAEPAAQTAAASTAVAPTEESTGGIASTVTQTTAASNNTAPSRGSVSLSTVLGILATERDRVASVERTTQERAAETGQASIAAVEALTADTVAQIQAQIADSNSSGGAGLANTMTTQDSAGSVMTSTSLSQSLGSGLIPGTASDPGLEVVLVEIPVPMTASVPDQGPALPTDFVGSTIIMESATGDSPVVITVQPQAADPQDIDIAPRSQDVTTAGFTAVDLLTHTAPESPAQESRPQDTTGRVPPTMDALGPQDITALAQAPQGFDTYSMTMPDTAFYAARDIYPRQAVVDNPRGRNLFGGSDRRHQELVDQQYRR